jgi:hypothetical protein
MLDEVSEDVEHLGLNLEQFPGAAQFIALGVECVIPKGVEHRLSLLSPWACGMVAPIIADT